jgi:hypothetical protein
VRERQNYNLTLVNCFSTTTKLNCMQIIEIAYRINTTKLYYLNLLGMLILRPLLVTLGRNTSITSKPTPLPPIPNI